MPLLSAKLMCSFSGGAKTKKLGGPTQMRVQKSCVDDILQAYKYTSIILTCIFNTHLASSNLSVVYVCFMLRIHPSASLSLPGLLPTCVVYVRATACLCPNEAPPLRSFIGLLLQNLWTAYSFQETCTQKRLVDIK